MQSLAVNPIRVGFNGFGKLGRLRYEKVCLSDRWEPVGFFDPRARSNQSGMRQCSSVDELLTRDELDAVIIATPSALTNAYVRDCLRSGVAVFAEKPPATSMDELLTTLKVYKNLRKPVLMYGFNHQHKPSFQSIMGIVNSGVLGEVLWMRGRYGKEMAEDFGADWRSDISLSGGGILLDQGIHLVDLMRQISGGFDQVSSAVSSRYGHFPGVEDNAFAILSSSQSGISASLHSTMTQWRYIFALEIFLENGSIVWNGLKTPSGNYGTEDLAVHARCGVFEQTDKHEYLIDEWEHELDIFAEAVVSRKPPATGSIFQALETLKLVEMIYRADQGFWDERQAALAARSSHS